jgi:hypothetical protein
MMIFKIQALELRNEFRGIIDGVALQRLVKLE